MPIQARYEELVEGGAVERDEAQLELIARMDALVATLAARSTRARGAFSWLFKSKPEPAPKGLYVWGEVGRGKTMLMDLFFAVLPVEKKRRAHFHAYMAEVHERIHAWRQKLKAGEVSGDDPIRPVADALADEAEVLCFDEFAVTDIADAMILGRLFTAMFERGVVVVATSNVPPDRLYRDGLNRALFLPFIRLLEERTEVARLGSRTDYRMEKIGEAPVYFSPLGPEAERAMDELFKRLAGGEATPATLTVLGHEVKVPAQAMGVARFGFEDLCARPLAASDYLAISRAFHTVFVDGIPVLGQDQRNEARRLILLVDVFYERHTKLVASAAAEPDRLYVGERGAETFEFARTASRLHEMRSREYLAAAAPDATSGSSTGLAET